jgi:hypothetical protein
MCITDQCPVTIYQDVDGTLDALMLGGASALDGIRPIIGSSGLDRLSPAGFQMLFSLFGPISSFTASRRMAGVFVGGSASARTFIAVMLVVIGAGHSVYAASSDDVDRMLGAVSAQAVKTKRHTTAYLACGAPDAPLIVFLHGWPELAISWRHQFPVFAELDFRCVAPDLRRYGRSGIYNQQANYALE